MNAIEKGARQAVVNCVKVQSGEKVVIITDHRTESLADAVKGQAEAVGASVSKFIMEDFGPRPDDGSTPLPFPEEIGAAFGGAQVSFYIGNTPAQRAYEKAGFKYHDEKRHPDFEAEIGCPGMVRLLREI